MSIVSAKPVSSHEGLRYKSTHVEDLFKKIILRDIPYNPLSPERVFSQHNPYICAIKSSKDTKCGGKNGQLTHKKKPATALHKNMNKPAKHQTAEKTKEKEHQEIKKSEQRESKTTAHTQLSTIEKRTAETNSDEEMIGNNKELTSSNEELSDSDQELSDSDKELTDSDKELTDSDKELTDSEMTGSNSSDGDFTSSDGSDEEFSSDYKTANSGPRVLAPIRTVQNPNSGKYMVDPFCSSYMDYQRKAEDELAQFLFIIVKKASEMQLESKFNYYVFNPENGHYKGTSDFNRALESGSALDLRWQLNHMNFRENAPLYHDYVFQLPRERQSRFIKLVKYIKDKGNNLAHKKHLTDRMQAAEEKSGSFKDILDLLKKMIKLVDEIYKAVQHIEDIVANLEIHRKNLEEIRCAFLELHEYKQTFSNNIRAFEQMTAEVKQQTALEVLEKIAGQCSGSDPSAAEDTHRIVALQFAPRLGIPVKCQLRDMLYKSKAVVLSK